MRPLLAATALLLLLATPALADGTKDAERKELEKDICYESRLLDQRRYEFRQEQNEFQRADPMGNLPKSLQAKGDENVLRGQRIGQLCERYKKKYGERAGCCGNANADAYLAGQRAKAEREATAAPVLAAENAKLMKLFPDDRVAPCRAFHAEYGVWPEACPAEAASPDR